LATGRRESSSVQSATDA